MGTTTQAVAVTGASGYIGRRVVERLLGDERVSRVVGVDIRASEFVDGRYIHVQRDIREPLGAALADAGVEAVAHLAFSMRQPRRREEGRSVNVGGAASALRACASANVGRVVLLSSATVYGARPDNPERLTEDAPLRPRRGFAYAEDKAQCEALFRRFGEREPSRAVSILRGCVTLGPNADNFITRALGKPALIGVRGADPAMQFAHEDDVAELLARFILEPHPGVYNVAGPGSLRWSELVAMAGKRLLALPAPIAYGLTDLSWAARAQSDSPGAGLDLIRWPWTVSVAKLAGELGHEFAYTSREAAESWLGRR